MEALPTHRTWGSPSEDVLASTGSPLEGGQAAARPESSLEATTGSMAPLVHPQSRSLEAPEHAVTATPDAEELRRQKAAQVDQMLLERVAVERSEEAFSELYDRFAPKVYSLLIYMLRIEEDAQDLLQEIFIIVWNKAPMFLETQGNVASWIMSLARNRAVDEMRSKRYKDRGRETTLTPAEDRPELAELVHHATPEALLSSMEAQREVRKALRALSEEQRSVVDLAYFGGLTHQEIAEKLNMPLGSVKSRMRQAVIKMARLLKPRL